MQDFRMELSKGLYLDDYDVLIEWKLSIEKFKEKIRRIKVLEVTEGVHLQIEEFSFKSKLFGLKDEFWININYVKGKIASVYLSKNPYESIVEDYFTEMQGYLEAKFGKPNGISNLFAKIIKDREDAIYKWHINNVRIVHSLFDLKSRTNLEIIIK